MSDTPRDPSRLQAELAQLRAALRTVEAPALDEASLRAQFRERAAAARARTPRPSAPAARGGSPSPPRPPSCSPWAVCWRPSCCAVSGPRPFPSRHEAPEAARSTVAAFQPLLNSPGLSPSSSYSVVRVRIPLSAFAVVPGTAQGGTIEADLLVGEDGLAHAIRFNEADALLVSVADQ